MATLRLVYGVVCRLPEAALGAWPQVRDEDGELVTDWPVARPLCCNVVHAARPSFAALQGMALFEQEVGFPTLIDAFDHGLAYTSSRCPCNALEPPWTACPRGHPCPRSVRGRPSSIARLYRPLVLRSTWIRPQPHVVQGRLCLRGVQAPGRCLHARGVQGYLVEGCWRQAVADSVAWAPRMTTLPASWHVSAEAMPDGALTLRSTPGAPSSLCAKHNAFLLEVR